jgi:hypothetical protein
MGEFHQPAKGISLVTVYGARAATARHATKVDAGDEQGRW